MKKCFFIPLMIVLIDTSIAYAWHAWVISEKSTLTYWYPPIAPFRTVVAVGLCVFALQGVAQLVRDLKLLIKNKSHD